MERRRQLMARLIAAFREPIQPETVAVYLDEMKVFTDDELDFAITYWIRERPKFPSISDLRQACQERKTAMSAWSMPDHLLEGPTEPPSRKMFVSSGDLPKSVRMAQLNKYPALLNRYKREDN